MNYIPSVVAKTKTGELKVGADALKPDFAPQARQFKRLMGTSEPIKLHDGSAWTPTMLSAEILKALKSAVKLRTNQNLENVVVTVPAMFNQPQCEATNEAAKLAGLNALVLLQEPIAAATAYLANNPVEGNYLVYDLGGGTFDVSLVRLRDGEMAVLEHGGDNYLGGSDFDRRVLEWVVQQVEDAGGDSDAFSGERERFALSVACEEARVALSDQDSTMIYLDDFDLPITKVELTQSTVVDLIEDLVTKTVEITRDRLRSRSLKPTEIKSLLLVGGPTQMPYVRARLQEEFGIPLSFEQDPMTVVAEGAAIHASTLLSSSRAPDSMAIGSSEEVIWDLHYDPVSPDPETTVAARVLSPGGFKGEARIVSESGDFETGWQMLVNGAFSVDVNLGRESVSKYRIEVRDLRGTLLACDPTSFAIRSGVRTAQPVAPYNYGPVVQGGKMKLAVKAGSPLPANGTAECAMAETLVAGSPGECRIYIVEGNSEHATEALQVGALTIRGAEIPRTLKAGEKVEVRIRIDESRRIKARVYFPLIDEERLVETSILIDAPDPQALSAALTETRLGLARIEDHVAPEEQDLVIRADREIERLEALVEKVHEGAVDEGYQVHKQLSDTQAALRPLRDRYEVKALYAEIAGRIEYATTLCQRYGDSMGEAKLADLTKDLDKALRLGQRDAMEGVKNRVMEIFWEHYGKTKECAEYQVQWMREAASAATDPVSYHEVVRRAQEALDRDDREGVLLQASRAWDFLPDRERMRNRFFDTGLRS
ncbi:MAG: chaperone protein DnaK [Armatimonadetes bacterium OLB18]|nr:MAG: chaperone protein DnaK [Armatimonadetes bacterium OLB18]